MDNKSKKDYINKINELYIMSRKKHIMQTNDGHYTTFTGTDSKPYTLVDWVIARHLENKITIGVFSGQFLTKLVGFDVDTKDHAPSMTKRLVGVLVDKYGISPESILVSFSGSKGYHVDVFFNKAFSIEKAKLFHQMILEEIEAKDSEIELRPTGNQGYKLPLSIHKKTGNFAYLVDRETLEKQPNDLIFDIVQEETNFILDIVNKNSNILNVKRNMLVLDNETAEEFEDVLSGLNMFIPTDYEDISKEILSEMSLIHPDTRHRTTLFTAIYLKEQGYSQVETRNIVSEIISNTYKNKRALIDTNTSIDHALYEVNRLTMLVYDRNYSIQERKPEPIRIYKEDVLLTLKPKRKELRQLLFSMICHSDRYAKPDGSFYMAYSVMSKMGNTKNRSRLYKYTTILEDEGYIKVLRRGRKREKSLLNEVNIYSVNRQQASNSSEYIELDSIEANDWERVVTQVLPEKELKPLVSSKVFYSTFKPYYTT